MGCGVCMGATLQCTFGAAPSALMVLPINRVVEPVPADLLALVTESAEEFQPLLTQHALALELPPAPTTPEGNWLLAIDAARLGQVVRNLLANAIKFSPAAGTITVNLQREERVIGRRTGDLPVPVVVLTVLDRGPGIPENEMESIFDKFVQSSKTKTGAGGTGLGLSICREIVEAHQGRIRAYNRPGGGAAFEVLLPAEHPAAIFAINSFDPGI